MAFTGDNATSNDTQTSNLAENPNNTFEATNRVRCYNHTLNLSVKALLKPFGVEKKRRTGKHTGDGTDLEEEVNVDPDSDVGEDDLPDLVDVSDSDDSNGDDDEQEEDDMDEFDKLDESEKARVLNDTEEVRSVISKA